MVNAVTFTSADGYELTFPYRWLLNHDAIIATQIGRDSAMRSVGSANQLWLSGAPARLFVRDIVHVSFEERDKEPELPTFEVEEMAFQNRPNVSAALADDEGAYLAGMSYRVGEAVCLKGYAHDYDRAIAAVELSFDNGATWARKPMENTDNKTAVSWEFAFTPHKAGHYEVLVRSVNEDGKVSPTPARVDFEVRA